MKQFDIVRQQNIWSHILLALALVLFTVVGAAARINEFVHLAADINQTPGTANLGGFTVFNNELYFTANDGTHGMELWKI